MYQTWMKDSKSTLKGKKKKWEFGKKEMRGNFFDAIITKLTPSSTVRNTACNPDGLC